MASLNVEPVMRIHSLQRRHLINNSKMPLYIVDKSFLSVKLIIPNKNCLKISEILIWL